MAEPQLARRNNALDLNNMQQNGKTVAIHQTVRGSDWYYTVCAVMGTTAFGILLAARMKPRTDRVFFYLTSGLCWIACIAYFAMGSNLGWTPIDVELLFKLGKFYQHSDYYGRCCSTITSETYQHASP
ncbi:hypothetical protein LTR43_011787, partial [Exophiala xenobiotica]